MKVISPIFSEMRGTLGGAVGSVARGGINYFRARIIPTNPRTLLQTAIRAAVQSASAIWQNTLTELQQDGWFNIAEGSQTGKSLFAKINQPRIYANNTIRVTENDGTPAVAAPAYFGDAPAGGLNTPFALETAPVVDDSANTLSIGTVGSGDWNANSNLGVADAMVFVYLSGPQSTSRAARQHPYQLVRAYVIDSPAGDIVFDPISLAALGIPTVAGRVFYVKTYAQAYDGRTSLPQEFRVVCTA